MFLDQPGKRIAARSTLRDSARIRKNYWQETAQQQSTGGPEPQKKISVRLVSHAVWTRNDT